MQKVLIKHRPLTFEYLNSLSEEDLREVVIQNLMIEESESKTNEDLFELDYQIWNIKIENNEYICIHGWPGGNPFGIVFQNNKILLDIGDGNEFLENKQLTKIEKKDIELFKIWYKKKESDGGFECN